MPDDIQQQKEIDGLRVVTQKLEVSLALAHQSLGSNAKLLTTLTQKVDDIAHTIDVGIVTNHALEDKVNSVLNKHAAKVFWSVIALAVGAIVTWIGSHLK